jgi:hypothetical protein
MTPVGRCDSGHVPNSSRKTRLQSHAWLRSYARLWLYAWLRSKDTTPIERRDSDRMPDSDQKAWLRSEDVTPVVCLTLVRRCNSSCMPNSGRETRPWLYAWLQLEDTTPVMCPTPVGRRDSSQKTRVRPHITTLVVDRTACLTYSFVKDFLWSS